MSFRRRLAAGVTSVAVGAGCVLLFPASAVAADAPVASDDVVSTQQARAVRVDVLDNDDAGSTAAPLVADSISFPVGLSAGATVTSDRKKVTIADEGSWSIDEDGSILFTPVPAFTGRTTSLRYAVEDADGNSASARVTVTVDAVAPELHDDVATTGPSAPTVVDVLKNDDSGVAGGSAIDPTSVRFPTGQPEASTVSADRRSLTLPAEGTWKINSSTGAIAFTPVAGFTGSTTSLTYEATDTAGKTATATITITVTVDVVAPTATSTISTTDRTLIATTLTSDLYLLNEDGTQTSSLRTPYGELLLLDGQLFFEPAANSQGTVLAVLYGVSNGRPAAQPIELMVDTLTAAPSTPPTQSGSSSAPSTGHAADGPDGEELAFTGPQGVRVGAFLAATFTMLGAMTIVIRRLRVRRPRR